MNILVSGAIAYDRILYFSGHFKDHFLPEKVHAISVSFDIEKIDESFGGTGGNIAYSLKMLETNPILFGLVGDDWERYKEWLDKLNISTKHIIHVGGSLTSQAHIMSDRDNNQITGFHQGAGNHLYEGVIPTDVADIAVVAPAHPKNMVLFSEHHRDNGIKYIFDPGQQVPTFTKEDFITCVESAWIFVANDYEMALSLEKMDWNEEELKEKVPIVITTLGEGGSIVYTEGKKFEIGIAPAEVVVDPTGAGDGYRAGLVKGLQSGLSIEDSARLAATVASYTIEKQGTQSHTFSMDEVARRYKKAFGKEWLLK